MSLLLFIHINRETKSQAEKETENASNREAKNVLIPPEDPLLAVTEKGSTSTHT
jgi:hypothetical protein